MSTVHDQPAIAAPSPSACRSCGSGLDAQQRYCLSCGARVAERRVPRETLLGAAGVVPPPPVVTEPAATVTPGPTPAPAGERVQVVLLAVLAIALPAFAVGLLLGDRGGDGPQVVTVAPAAGTGAPATAAAAVPTAAFADTWPAGTNAWTVQLQTLPKATATPAAANAARDAAIQKGAPDVGTLDSDTHPPLPGGSYVIYSGVHATKAAADSALDGLRASFPEATVVRIGEEAQSASDGAGSENEESAAGAEASGSDSKTVDPSELPTAKGLSPEEFQKQSKKLPQETALPGKAPPKDNAAPGGEDAGEAVEIG